MDHFLQHWINREAISPFCDHFMVAVASFSLWLPLIVISFVVAGWKGDFKMRAMLFCLAVGIVFNDGLLFNTMKHWVGRPRPFQSEPGVRVVELKKTFPPLLTILEEPKVQLLTTPLSGTNMKKRSFPSSHAGNMMFLAMTVFLFYRRFGILLFLIAGVVGYSRIYTGSHWPSDVLCGFILGMLSSTIVVELMNQAWKKWGVRWNRVVAERHPSLFS